jgi:processive 1,2-diacylglycerol beta-glucosyltransferase
MRKILFLVSRPGLGHIRCAEAVSKALPWSGSENATDMLDVNDLIDGRVSEAIIDGYLRMTEEQPELYQRLYDLDRDLYRQLSGSLPADQVIAEFLAAQQQRWFPGFAVRDWLAQPRRNFDRALLNTLVNGVRQSHKTHWDRILMHGLVFLIYRVLARRLREAVRQRRPDVLVATQMYPNALLSPARLAGHLPQPLIGVMTDFGVHGIWVRETTDYYCVAHPEAARELQARGVPRQKILVTGIPLMPSFTDPPGQEEARARLGLPRRPVVLVTGGEYGFGTREAVQRLTQEADGPMVLVTTPRNGHGARDFEALARANPKRLRICSWTDEMPWLMRAADVVVGKPGGLTISESLACGRPFIATCCLGGQEAHNVRFLEGRGVGLRLEAEDLPDFLGSLFAEPGKLQHWQASAAGAGYRRGANAVAELVRRCAADDQYEGGPIHAESG